MGPPDVFDKYSHYADVKMTQTLCAFAHADELGSGDIAVHAVHPGCVQTGIVANAGFLGPFSSLAGKSSWLVGHISPTEGASYVLRVCLSSDCAPSAGTARYYHCGQLS